MGIEHATSEPSAAVFALSGTLSNALRTRSRAGVRRASVLGDSLGLFDSSVSRAAPDGYPRIDGTFRGRAIELSFIQDTLTAKRLPQLWLSIVLRATRPSQPLVLTARPRGDDYVSLASRVRRRLDVPAWLPNDFAVHGDGDARAVLASMREPISAAFADPRTKEIAFTANRIHLLHRFSEGRRSRHLLFRECIFAEALSQERLRHLIETLLLLEGQRAHGRNLPVELR